ncbi:hypothetical protein CLU79DRAFT_740489 [Phycomyces nitens]|nr:hypothetical protein CLU79DRAFT_740489 [Phycomyces nitens]
MINGTKLLNVVGMSRGKRDGILKNEKGRVVVKVGAMHLKGVWITFSRAKDLATKFKIVDLLYPLFVDDPSVFLYASNLQNPNGNMPLVMPSSCDTNRATNSHQLHSSYKTGASYTQFPIQPWDRPYQSLPSITSTQQESFRSQTAVASGSCSPVPGTISSMLGEDSDLYLMNNPYEYRSSANRSSYSSIGSSGHPYGTNHHASNGLGVPGIYSSVPGHHDSPSYSTHYDTTSFTNRKSHYDESEKEYSPNQSADPTEDNDTKSLGSGQIDFPSSPPPESGSQIKLTPYSHTSASSSAGNPAGTFQSMPSFSSTWSASFGSLNQSASEGDSKMAIASSCGQGRTEGILSNNRQSFDGKIGAEEKTAVAGMVKANRKQSTRTDDLFKPSKALAGRKKLKGDKADRA